MVKLTIGQLLDLSGRTAIVTGAGQGMGQAIAFRLAEAGANVVIAHRRIQDAERTVAQMAGGVSRGLAIQADVSVLRDIDRVVASTVEMFGRLDILVNNAGGMHPFTPFVDMTEEAWQATMERNVKSCYFMSQRAMREMISGGNGGRILHIASVEASRPFPLLSAYSASKAAVASLTSSMAFEGAAHGVRVNAISPGPIRTPNTAAAYADPEVESTVKARLPMGRIGDVDDVATAALFLVSDAAAFVTGSVLTVDGGFLST